MFSTIKAKSFGFLITLCLITLPIGYLQAQGVITDNEMMNIGKQIHGSGIMTLQASQYIGSPFFNKFQRGYVLMNGNTRSQSLLLRYNMLNNNVQFMKNKTVYMIPAKKLNGFVINTSDGDITFENGFKINKRDINQNTFLYVIYDGNVKLLAHYTSTKMNVATYGTATKKVKFMKHSNYYMQTPNGSFHKVKLKKKDILDVLKAHQKEVKKYAKKHHLSFKKPTDLKKILAYYDSINANTNS